MTDQHDTAGLMPRYGQVDRDFAMRMATTPPDEDGPIWMVNLMKYREIADYTDGRDLHISGREADDLYTPLESLRAVGAVPVFFGDVAQQFLGASPTWDRIAVVKYPSRRAFIEMQSRPEFKEAHQHKDAGMEQTIVIGCVPIELPDLPEMSAQLDWADVPNPPTAEDGPLMIVHVLRFEDEAAARTTPDEMRAYQSAAAGVAFTQGIRLAGWFAVEGTIIGDGRAWHQVRFNLFPSQRAFMAVVTDPERQAAQKEHREAAIADTYTMSVRPLINDIEASISR